MQSSKSNMRNEFLNKTRNKTKTKVKYSKSLKKPNLNSSDVVVFKNFTKKFGPRLIGPFNFSIKRGTITAILGTSGAGKSVTINAFMGATARYKGQIIVNGISRKSFYSYRINRDVGFYTQMDFSLFDITAWNFLRDISLMGGLKKADIEPTVTYWMKFFGLWPSKDKKLKDFSWGMKNRINLLLCFLKDPAILVMDEPGANLDTIWRYKIKMLIQEMKAKGKTIIITVHHIDEIIDIIDEFVIIESGRVVFNGPVYELPLSIEYKFLLANQIDYVALESFLIESRVQLTEINEAENSFIVTFDNAKKINVVFLFFLKQNNPIIDVTRLPIQIETIHTAIVNSMQFNQNNPNQQ